MKRHVIKTLAYLDSERGKLNWAANEGRGYSYEMNMCAAVQTATRLLKYEHIIAVIHEVNVQRKVA